MSEILVNAYLAEIDRLKRVSGRSTEQIIREAFKDLLKAWSKQRGLSFVAELEHATGLKTKVCPDGTVLHDLRVPLGFWEAEDTADDLDAEIAKKFVKGYPKDNILFEDSATAVLWQNGREILRAPMTDVAALDRLVTLFFDWERPEIAEFRAAVEQFKADLPSVLDALRSKIDAAYAGNAAFRAAAAKFLDHARETINPTLAEADVREMLIQHVLTEEIFAHVFNDGDFHRENNIAKELYTLEGMFFTGGVKRDTLRGLEPYYAAIRKNAAQITSHQEKQTFLKVIYENFYKVYNPKAADRLGVVYTPNEIVRFMVEGADWLCHKHFGKTLIDRDVEILDPATGTGTFICELIEHFRGQPDKLRHKYREELHANEVAILPYYVANLNIEATYAAVAGGYEEFPNLCFVDTLDNVAGLGKRAGHIDDLFAALSDENVARVKRQNKRKISVVIGNPPYNAWQENFNQRNANRGYTKIDQRIKETYVLKGKAQNQNSVYDMYTRFFRWASDRVHDDGVVVFIAGRNPFEKKAYDGFRRDVASEYNEIYIVDLGGDVVENPKLSGTKHNVFGNKSGAAIYFLVKRHRQKGCKVFYVRRDEFETADEKLSWLNSTQASEICFDRVYPSKSATWINDAENEWQDLLPVVAKEVKSRTRGWGDKALLQLFSNGLQTKKDEWMYDFNLSALCIKMQHVIETYEHTRNDINYSKKYDIKWDRELERRLKRDTVFSFSDKYIAPAEFRPFTKKFVYRDQKIVSINYGWPALIGDTPEYFANQFISVSNAIRAGFSCLAINRLVSIDYFVPDSTQVLPRYRYTPTGERIDNITDWALKQFRDHYGKAAGVTKDAIFHYVYAALHDPVWRETYAINLRREFPRLPFHADFRRWAEWGARLMELHIGYEAVEPWPVVRTDTADVKARAGGVRPRVILKSDPGAGTVTLDSETVLSGLPAEVWAYRLGNRSGVDWVLDQHKEKKPRDPTIRARFDTYRFADHREKVADLVARVARVSVETVGIVEEMRAEAAREAGQDSAR